MIPVDFVFTPIVAEASSVDLEAISVGFMAGQMSKKAF